MQSLLQSAFLQALGYAIFNSLWQVALLWIVVMIVNSAGKLGSSGKYFAGALAQFAGFVWFLFTLRFYYIQCSEVIANAQSAGATDNSYYFYEPIVNNFSSGLMYVIIKTEQLLPYLSVAYLFMLLFLSVRLIRAYVYTKKIRTEGLLKPDVEWKLFVKKTAGYLGIQKDVILYFSELVKSPLTLGFIKPLILVPVASLNHLSVEQLEAILLHELAHIKRADYLFNIIQSIIEVSLFFNPFMQLLGKLIKKERENSCDDWVLQFQYKPAMYAEALLRIAYIQTGPSFALQASGKGTKGELLPRVKRMLNQQEKTHHYRNHLLALLLITVMLTTVAWFTPSANKQIIHNSPATNSKKVMVEPFSAKVESPLYNPFFYLITRPLQEEIKAAVNNIATNKLADAIPHAKEMHDVINKVTPIALESLREAYSDVAEELPSIQKDAEQAMLEAKIELNKIKIDDINITDSIEIASAISKLVQKELAKIDWSQVNTDLEKARVDFTSMTQKNQDDYLNETKINEALQQVALQLQLLNNSTKNISFDAKGLLNKLLEKKKDLLKIEQSKQLQERIKQGKEKKKNNVAAVVAAPKPLKVWSDMKRDDYSFGIDESEVANIASPQYKMAATATAPAYAPVAYNDNYEDAESYNDGGSQSDSAIIIVLHNPENEKSHTKNITVQIAGKNGTVKTYTFTVDVYQ